MRFVILISALILGCQDNAGFQGPDGKKGGNDNLQPRTTVPEQEAVTVKDSSLVDPACLFTVSGTWIGDRGAYEMAYPGTISGREVQHGEYFDKAGGVYLRARSEPYVHRRGDREIDKAVDNTFDSIAVPPHVSYEIRDEYGALLSEGVGPYMALSKFYAEDTHPEWVSPYIDNLLSQADLPEWMLAETRKIEAIRLQSAREVLVSAVPGSPCAP